MLKIKDSKFLKTSLIVTICVVTLLAALALLFQFQVNDVILLYSTIGAWFITIICYLLFFLFYPIIWDFVNESYLFSNNDSKKTVRMVSYIYCFLLCVAILFYLHLGIKFLAIVELLSFFIGLSTIVFVINKAKNGYQYKKEILVGLIAFVLFVLTRGSSLDSNVNPFLFSIIIVLIMMIIVNNKVVNEKFFKINK